MGLCHLISHKIAHTPHQILQNPQQLDEIFIKQQFALQAIDKRGLQTRTYTRL